MLYVGRRYVCLDQLALLCPCSCVHLNSGVSRNIIFATSLFCSFGECLVASAAVFCSRALLVPLQSTWALTWIQGVCNSGFAVHRRGDWDVMCGQAAPEEDLEPFEVRFTVRAWPSPSRSASGARVRNSCPVRPVSTNIRILRRIAENSCRSSRAACGRHGIYWKLIRNCLYQLQK